MNKFLKFFFYEKEKFYLCNPNITWFIIWTVLGLVNFFIWVFFGFDMLFSQYTNFGSIYVWFVVLLFGFGIISVIEEGASEK